MISSVLFLAFWAVLSDALVLDLPRPTSVIKRQLLGPQIIPRPTAAPRLPQELRRRQDQLAIALIGPDQTCGFISGLAGAGFNCDASDYCVFYPPTATDVGSIACCDPDVNDCAIATTCIDSSEYYFATSICDNGCRLDTNTLKCTEFSLPFCNSVSFPNEGVQGYSCDSISVHSFQLAYTTFDGENAVNDGRLWSTDTYGVDGYDSDGTTTSGNHDPISLTGNPSDYYTDIVPSTMTIILTSSFSSPYSSSSSSLLSSPVSISSSTVVGAATSSSTSGTPNLDENRKSSTPVGAIVGGVLGGIALIALIAAGAFVLNRTYTKKDSDSSRSNPPLTYGNGHSEMGASGSNTPMYQHQHQYYEPQTPQQAYNPSFGGHQYEPVPTAETPIFRETHYPDEPYLTPRSNLRGTDSIARTFATPVSTPTSPTPGFVAHPPADIAEVPGSSVFPTVGSSLGYDGATHEGNESKDST